MDRIESHRLFFARLITANAGIASPENPVVSAFAETPREQFVGAGPWHFFTPAGYVATPTNDAAFVYYDAPIALDRDRQLNNGQPVLHAICLGALAVKPGETVVHIGAGTGYYTAILSTLVGSHGKVFAYELDNDLAQRATTNLVTYSNASVRCENGAEAPIPECDVIYVNAGATGPAESWLNALRSGGRLLFPLTPADVNGRPAAGAMLLITRKVEGLAASFICPAAFTPCIGARDQETAARLTPAFARGDWRKVKCLRLDAHPDDSCWCAGSGWWLSTQPLNA